MRKDHYTPPSKWMREFKMALKLGDAHFKVYAYLEGSPESHATGIYFVLPATIGAMLNEERETVVGVLQDLDEADLIRWDSDADVVWIPCVCKEQFRWQNGIPKDSDNRTKEARRHLAALPETPLCDKFLDVWPIFKEQITDACKGSYQAPLEGLLPVPVAAPLSLYVKDNSVVTDRGSDNEYDWDKGNSLVVKGTEDSGAKDSSQAPSKGPLPVLVPLPSSDSTLVEDNSDIKKVGVMTEPITARDSSIVVEPLIADDAPEQLSTDKIRELIRLLNEESKIGGVI